VTGSGGATSRFRSSRRRANADGRVILPAHAIGDENDVFGGIGRNGAVKMKPDEFVKGRLLPHMSPYQFVAKKLHNLQADEFISNHHDVTGRQVANALLYAIG
jgi:hypothetical protein